MSQKRPFLRQLDFALELGAFVLLAFWKWPPWLAVGLRLPISELKVLIFLQEEAASGQGVASNRTVIISSVANLADR